MMLKKIRNKKLNIQKTKLNFYLKKRKKIFIFKESYKNSFVKKSLKYTIDRRLVNKRFFYQYKLSQKRLKHRFYVNKNPENKKVIFFDKKIKQKPVYKENAPDYWLFIKPTVNNLFAYIYNIDVLKEKSLLRMRKFFKKKNLKIQEPQKKKQNGVKFMCLSLGVSGYKGPTKSSYVAAEETGVLFNKKLKKKKLTIFNLVLLCRLNRRIKMFMKGLQRVNKLKFKYIYSMPCRAHNGSRVKKRRRK